MNVHECIKTRRSMRKYKDEPIPPEKLERVLAAIQWAPSWVNFQPWEVVVVDDQEVKAALMDCVSESNPGRKAVGQAPTVLAICGRLGESGYYKDQESTVHGDWIMFDLGIAAQNLCLAAWAEGLGSLHLGLLDHDKAAAVLELPENVKLYELVPIGIPAKEGKAPPRKEVQAFTHKNKYGA